MRDGRCADWSAPVGPAAVMSHRTASVTTELALRAAELGDDAVAIAPVDRLDVLDRPVRGGAARPLEQEGRRVEWHAQGGGLLLVRHRGLDRLRAARDLDAVALL